LECFPEVYLYEGYASYVSVLKYLTASSLYLSPTKEGTKEGTQGKWKEGKKERRNE
jgi:hypothetical protein